MGATQSYVVGEGDSVYRSLSGFLGVVEGGKLAMS